MMGCRTDKIGPLCRSFFWGLLQRVYSALCFFFLCARLGKLLRAMLCNLYLFLYMLKGWRTSWTLSLSIEYTCMRFDRRGISQRVYVPSLAAEASHWT